MAKALSYLKVSSRVLKSSGILANSVLNKPDLPVLQNVLKAHVSRAPTTSTLSASMSCVCSSHSHFSSFAAPSSLTVNCSRKQKAFYSTEVDKEISKFLEKEIQYETSKVADTLPKISGCDIQTDGGDVTLTKTLGSEKLVIRLSVNGAVDSVVSEQESEKQNEPPQMICRPPFEVEITKGDGMVLALQCSFPPSDDGFEDGQQYNKEGDAGEIDDQFEIQEVAIHGGEWKDTTYSVSAATMDAELFDLLMDMLDERGVTDDFIIQLVDYCTAYESKQYISFLKNLKTFAEK